MKINLIRCSMIALLIALGVVAAGRANAQKRHEVLVESWAWGISSGQTARVSVGGGYFAFGDGSVRFIKAEIHILDSEGEVIAKSGEIRVAPGQIRFWDVHRGELPIGEPSGRLQVRVRILVTTDSIDVSRPKAPFPATLEIIDSATGKTALISTEWIFVA